ncbi:MAG: VWA domain-containing protein [Candidatus Latescibacteria bacterium]|nr:VWA domain-containing protein [Candidatus Latescibacterota bacterium]
MKTWLALALLVSAVGAGADGFILPPPPQPPLAVKYHRVKVAIDDQAARTDIDQVFLNPAPFDVEGTYIFPLPLGASFSAFSMHVDGEPLQAEILDAIEARRIYEEIVRQRIDPALLEYAGRGAYRARIFPIPAEGERRVELAYEEVLKRDGGVVRYIYPLNTEKFSPEPLEDVSVQVDIRSSSPIKAVYSPSHEIVVERLDDHRVRVIYADEGVTPSRDFALYYTVSDSEVGLDLLSYFPNAEQEGYYLLLAAPQIEPVDEVVTPKRIVFVFDRSGSMAGGKMDQARASLRFAVGALNEDDVFNIVDYGTTVSSFADSAVAATPQQRQLALDYVDGLEALGGTNIDGALERGLGMVRGDGFAEMVVFLTDGKPTIGQVDIDAIIAAAEQANGGRARLFVFGVGDEVNTHLLDRLASGNGGTSAYVRPGEDIAQAVAAFYAKVSNPVLTALRLNLEGGRRSDFYPPELPDLFSGAQLVQLGRLQASGAVQVELAGVLAGAQRVFTASFARDDSGPEFLPRLWATRKVGFLLDQIRLNGEDDELVEEIVALSRRYGIITPYTSFLIVEDEVPVPVLEEADALRADSGAEAVSAAQQVRSYANAGTTTRVRSAAVRYVGDKTFYERVEGWRDSRFDSDAPVQVLAFGSEAYFTLVADRPQLGRYLALGRRVEVVFEDVQYRIVETATQIKEKGVGSGRPGQVRLEQNYPNPFNSATTLRYWLETAGRVRLELFDLQGQRIRTLVDRPLEPGSHIAQWNGLNQQGEGVAGGVYLARMEMGGRQQVRKVLLVK